MKNNKNKNIFSSARPPGLLRSAAMLFSQAPSPDHQVGSAAFPPYLLLWDGEAPKQLLLPATPCGNHCANDAFPNTLAPNATGRVGRVGGGRHMVTSLPVIGPSAACVQKLSETPAVSGPNGLPRRQLHRHKPLHRDVT